MATIRGFIAASGLSVLALAGCSHDETQSSSSSSGSSSGSPPTEVTGPLGMRADLPVDEQIVIENLTAPVDIVRDKDGRPHIYASNFADAMRAEGYLVARDRHLQLEFFRRVSEGRLAEILAGGDPSTIDLDIAYRHIGLGRVAKAEYDALPDGDLKDIVDAFSDGVSQVFRKIRSGEIHLPSGIFGIDPQAFTDWNGVDCMAIARLQTHLLSYDGDSDISLQLFFDAIRKAFPAMDPDPLVAKRAGIERDVLRFAPSNPATTTTGYPMTMSPLIKGPLPGHGAGRQLGARGPNVHLSEIAGGYVRAMQHSRQIMNPEGFGSNNWAISGSMSATGHALVASDPHLSLVAPSVFWPVSIDVDDKKDASKSLKVGGVAFPGIPGIILGHNEHIAWGATVAGYDVSDAYAETLTPDGKSVMFKGNPVALQEIDEVIKIQDKAPYTYKVMVVPHHGPIEPNIQADHTVAPPDPKLGAISIRWTGLEPTNEFKAIMNLLNAKDVDTARAALKDFGVGAQNWMIGDTSGNILWTSHSNVPIRDPKAFQWDASTYQGTLPCMVLPGDGSAEWKGYLPDDLVPWEKNPASGFISTANNDPIGVSLDNDPSNDTLPDKTPMYLHCSFDIGFREGRIQSLIKGHQGKFTAQDLQAIQRDVRSSMAVALAPALIAAIDAAEEEKKTPGTHPDLSAIVKDPGYDSTFVTTARDLLKSWGTDADYQAESGIDPDTNQPLSGAGSSAKEVMASQATLVFNAWLIRVLARTFGDEMAKVGSLGHEFTAKAFLYLMTADPKTLATYDATTGESSLWDDMTTPEVESKQERFVHALVDAKDTLTKLAGSDPTTYRWGAYHKISFDALVPLFNALSIPPGSDTKFAGGFPRHGDSFSIDACDYSYVKLTSNPDFTYAHGPSQRFVADMDPAGPKVENALPGGAIWDAKSPHFRDQMELWRRNQTHTVPFLVDDVVAYKESRTVAAPKAP